MRKLKTTDMIYTHSGEVIFPEAIDPSQLNEYDIALGLRYIYRYNGQIPITVLRHSIGLYNLCVTSATALLALLHDAPEAYLMDVPVPKKRYMKKSWQSTMARLETLIEVKFGLHFHPSEYDEVYTIDKKLVRYEMNIASKLLPGSKIKYPGTPLKLNTHQAIHHAYMWHKSDDDLIEFYIQALRTTRADALRARAQVGCLRRTALVISYGDQFPAFERAYQDLISDS